MTLENTTVRIIKRYQNRKLYDTETSGYVTTADVLAMYRASPTRVIVLCNKTKEDITVRTIARAVGEVAETNVAVASQIAKAVVEGVL